MFHKLHELIQAGDLSKPLEAFQGHPPLKTYYTIYVLIAKNIYSTVAANYSKHRRDDSICDEFFFFIH